jgi:C-terminal processing protease CtpA/Prc
MSSRRRSALVAVRRAARPPLIPSLLVTSMLACAADRGTIGAMLGQSDDRRLVLREVPPDLAAGKAGLQPGDELILIDGRDVRELDERGVHQALGGSVSEPVKLTLLRSGQVIRVTLQRTPAPEPALKK